MCEADAYLRGGGKDELVMQSVDHVQPQENSLLLENVFGRRKVLKASRCP